MKQNEIKETERFLKSSIAFIGNCVDAIGYPKKPTGKQLLKFSQAIRKFEKAFKNFSYEQ